MPRFSASTYRFGVLASLLLASLFSASAGVALDPPNLGVLLKRDGCNSLDSACSVGADPNACLDFICASCGPVYPPIAKCCAGGSLLAKLQCLEDALQDPEFDDPVTSTPTSSAAPTTITGDPNLAACQSWNAIYQSCGSATPAFTSLTNFSVQASCLCYTSSKFAPTYYDLLLNSCVHYLATGTATAYASISIPANSPTPCAALAGALTASNTQATFILGIITGISTQSAALTTRPLTTNSTSKPAVVNTQLLTHPTNATIASQSATSRSSSTTISVTSQNASQRAKEPITALLMATVLTMMAIMR